MFSTLPPTGAVNDMGGGCGGGLIMGVLNNLSSRGQCAKTANKHMMLI